MKIEPLSADKEMGIPSDLLLRLPSNMMSAVQGIKVNADTPLPKRSKQFENIKKVIKDEKSVIVREQLVTPNQQQFLAQRRQAMENLQHKKEEEMAKQKLEKEKRAREVDRIATLMMQPRRPAVPMKPAKATTVEPKKPNKPFNLDDTLKVMKKKS
jgi:hypothetical protein